MIKESTSEIRLEKDFGHSWRQRFVGSFLKTILGQAERESEWNPSDEVNLLYTNI